MSVAMKNFLQHLAAGVASAAVMGALGYLGSVDWATLGVYGPMIQGVVHSIVASVHLANSPA